MLPKINLLFLARIKTATPLLRRYLTSTYVALFLGFAGLYFVIVDYNDKENQKKKDILRSYDSFMEIYNNIEDKILVEDYNIKSLLSSLNKVCYQFESESLSTCRSSFEKIDTAYKSLIRTQNINAELAKRNSHPLISKLINFKEFIDSEFEKMLE